MGFEPDASGIGDDDVPHTRRGITPLLIACGALLLTGCSGPATILAPRGPQARTITGLWWLLFWISIAVLVVVVALLGYSLRRRRGAPASPEPAPVPAWGHRFVVYAGFVVPAIVLITVFIVSLVDLTALARTGDQAQLQIEVIGHMWWWEARYPGGAVTANEIHIPVGQPVKFMVTSADVIHSFWVPALGPKRDMIPGRENELTLEADQPGRYRGQCAEFCGLQHANMAFYVVADPNFDQWLAGQQAQAQVPSSSVQAGETVFLHSTCVGCHTIRGTDAQATVGPDLTHLASRDTVFAGLLANTRQNLATIVTDPQSVKPGVSMPPTSLHPDQLQALLDYLQSLR